MLKFFLLALALLLGGAAQVGGMPVKHMDWSKACTASQTGKLLSEMITPKASLWAWRKSSLIGGCQARTS